jgi:hypothetical protein
MKATMAMKPTTRSTIPCYSPDGTSLGYRTLAAAQRLVADGYVRPAYGRKGHLRAIWLLRDDGTSPVQSHAHNGTRYSFIEQLETGRCWQLRRLDGRYATAPDGLPANARAPFLQVIQECMAPPPDAPTRGTLPTAKPATAQATTAKPVTTAKPATSAKPAGTEAASQDQASHDRGSQDGGSPAHASDHDVRLPRLLATFQCAL